MHAAVEKPVGQSAKVRKTLKRIQVLFNKNRLQDVKPLCDEAYATGVRGAEFLHTYGLALRACGCFDQALAMIFAAHEETPEDASILNSLGLVFRDMGDVETAIAMFKRATSKDERFFDAWVNLGAALRSVGRQNAAELAFTCAHHLDRRKPEPLLNLALIKVELHQYERAATFLDEFLSRHKNAAAGIKLMRLQVAMALEDLDYVKKNHRAIERKSLRDEDRVVLDGVIAQCHIISDEFDAAISILETSAAIPGLHQADHLSHLGFCYGLAGRVEDGISCLKKLLADSPEHASGRHNLALLQFRNGEVTDGFQNYDARLALPEFASKRGRFSAPMWNGEPINGKRILVWKEQGIGDEVRYASLLPELNALGGAVTIECAEKISPLWQKSFPWAAVHPAVKDSGGEALEQQAFDFQIPIGSLGKMFRASVADFDEKQAPWIKRNFDVERQIRDQLAIQPEELVVGVCWRSTVQIASRDKVFLNCEQLAPLCRLPNVRWINLQYASTEDEHQTIRTSGLDLHHYDDLDQMNDLVGACHLIGACDLVISVGGSVGDLAGGVGTPLIYMTRENSEAFLGTDRVPWFPNCKSYPIRAFKGDETLQKIGNDWASLAQWAISHQAVERQQENTARASAARPSLDLKSSTWREDAR